MSKTAEQNCVITFELQQPQLFVLKVRSKSWSHPTIENAGNIFVHPVSQLLWISSLWQPL